MDRPRRPEAPVPRRVRADQLTTQHSHNAPPSETGRRDVARSQTPIGAAWLPCSGDRDRGRGSAGYTADWDRTRGRPLWLPALAGAAVGLLGGLVGPRRRRVPAAAAHLAV